MKLKTASKTEVSHREPTSFLEETGKGKKKVVGLGWQSFNFAAVAVST